MTYLKRVFNIADSEWRSTAYSFLYFFFLMSSYFILRPVRDEMGIAAGIENMQWLFTGTFIVMLLLVPLFGYLVKMVPRRILIPRIYLFFALNILLYYFAFRYMNGAVIAAVFFIWLSVFNLFVISIFWSFNADIFGTGQAKRLFGPIAAGGSLGAILGPSLTSLLVGEIGILNLLLVSAFLLLLSTVFIHQLLNMHSQNKEQTFLRPIQGSIWGGLALIRQSPMLKLISVFILLFTTISTFLYFQQGHIISESISSPEARTTYFGTRDLLVNSSTLILQFFLTEKVIRKWGLSFSLTLLPMVACAGFVCLGFSPTVYVLLGFQVTYRSLNFAIQRPAREILFTSVSAEERYKSKNFIDTAIYRSGDAVSGWLFAGLAMLIASPLISFIAIPITIVWLLTGSRIGKHFHTFNQTSYATPEQTIETTSA